MKPKPAPTRSTPTGADRREVAGGSPDFEISYPAQLVPHLRVALHLSRGHMEARLDNLYANAAATTYDFAVAATQKYAIERLLRAVNEKLNSTQPEEETP